ncbi:Uncharacterised protein [Vibrio cholerae]|nr:Uncharacterised protein [Vibrio cholerae]CSC46947.1 Uncharacterised protein [Vibrio cholerae]
MFFAIQVTVQTSNFNRATQHGGNRRPLNTHRWESKFTEN